MTANDYLHDIKYIDARVEEELVKRDESSAIAYIEDIKTLCDRLVVHINAIKSRADAAN